jgi:hypothetical protein
MLKLINRWTTSLPIAFRTPDTQTTHEQCDARKSPVGRESES